jgi:hypothetical protein
MKKILLRILFGVAALIVIVAIVASTRPDTFSVQRSIIVSAAPERIASEIADFHRWAGWSPFEKMDPAMQRTYTGAERGVGAVYAWHSDSHVGAGRMEIVDTTRTRITIKLDFLKPFEAHNTALFLMEPNGNATKVTWEMYGTANLLSKAMGLFFDMDAMIGKDFESGLSSLKQIVES